MSLAKLTIESRGRALDFVYRPDSEGDVGVVRQIFRDRDYEMRQWEQGRRFLDACSKRPGTGLIVDAGANIGAATVFFLETYENVFLYAVEPDMDNMNLLRQNTSAYNNACVFEGAISNNRDELYLLDPGLSDWGFRTTTGHGISNKPLRKVAVITPAEILRSCSSMYPMIMKIDIEGGEDKLFSGDSHWMNQFGVIIIELHDWMFPGRGCSRNFLRAVATSEFDFLQRGENIFLFNREWG